MESIGIRVTISAERNRVISSIEVVDPARYLINAESEYSRAITIPITASALAGVGRPLNDVICVSSVLNFASRNPAQTGMITGESRISIVRNPAAFSNAGLCIERDAARRL
jgi:hypothetical protein